MDTIHFNQKKFSDKISFIFKDEGLDYTIIDNSGKKTFYSPYLSIDTKNYQEIIEKKPWFRQVGYLWLIVGVAFYFTGVQSGYIFALLGAGCLCIYYFKQIKFTILRSDQGNIYIINDHDKDNILNKIVENQKLISIKKFGPIDYTRTFEEEKAKYKYFLDEGFIELDKFNKYLATMEETKNQFRVA